ncbi:hypothetical protein [Amycolatopsis palatopharyngis]|uniref:hypothetical protein n=1 Tax=Amycolatopsis palatopharyngis TaxID=187982 RepID=UPI000E2615B8|nr:hypothetical protein [Amycolatopsis palatopharyngis]
MNASNQGAAWLRFDDLRRYAEHQLGTEDWVTLYSFKDEAEDSRKTIFCALVSPDHLDKSLSDTDWDLLPGDGGPHLEGRGDDSYRFVRVGDEPVEPFVLRRHFQGPKPSYCEISEEFRLFHALYEDKKTGEFFQYDEAGDEIPVARIKADTVEVRLKYLREYLTVRDMYLVILFEYARFSTDSLDDLGLSGDMRWNKRTDNLAYQGLVEKWETAALRNAASSCGLLRGKKVIRGNPGMGSQLRRRRKYEEFIYGMDPDGDEVSFTCDKGKLSNSFGANPGAPDYLTPVFFQRDVLAKYYASPDRYEVTDSGVSCGGAWSVRIDNNHFKYVTVFLGDLGDLPNKEQLYWRSFNIPPEGTISQTNFERSFLGFWVEPSAPDLFFRSRYVTFARDWYEKFGWHLFRPLSAAEGHHLTTLHIPRDGNEAAFDNLVISLTKVLIESLNGKELDKHLDKVSGEGSIAKFERYLASQKFHPEGTKLDLYRNLQGLRSGAAHIKGGNYDRFATFFGLNEKGHAETFAEILGMATDFLCKLAEHYDLGWEDPDEQQELLNKLR